MHRQRKRASVFISVASVAASCGIAVGEEQPTAIAYSGELIGVEGGAVRTCEFEFALWDDAKFGERIGRTLIFDGWEANRPRLSVKDGWFDVVLDFGIAVDDDAPLFVETRYSCGRGAPWSTAANRDEVTTDLLVKAERNIRPVGLTPISLVPIGDDGETAAGVPDGHSLDAVDGDPIDAVFVDADGNVGVGTSTPASTLDVRGDLSVDGPIRINGDNNPLEFHVNGTRALRFEYSDALSEAPNVIGGHPSNNVVPLKAGAVIAGGGSATAPNQVSEDWGTVSGGKGNEAFGALGTVSGGSGNTAAGEGSTVSGGQNGMAGGLFSAVGGGTGNTAGGGNSVVMGGTGNTANGPQSTIGGGQTNTAAGANATVPGGMANAATGDFSMAAGKRAKANHVGSFVWADSTAADFPSTTNNQFRVRATGGASFSHNVGIGTTTPGIPLTFDNVLGNKISLWGGVGTQEHYGFGIQSSTLQMYAPLSAKLAFGHGRSGAFTERMQIAANGYVGIGTAPSYPFQVLRAASTGDWGARFSNGTSNVFLANGGGFGMHINTGNASNSAQYGLQVRNNVRTHLYVRNDGNVGIGTSGPGSALDVRGDARVSGLIRSAGQDFKIRRGSFAPGNFTLPPQGQVTGGRRGYGTTFSSTPVVIISYAFTGGNFDVNNGMTVTTRGNTSSVFGWEMRNTANASVNTNVGTIHWIAIGQ